VTFSDNGDGTGAFAGDPSDGTGGTYPVTLTLTNALGTTTEPLTLVVDQQASNTSNTQVTWIAGQSSTFTIRTSGYPSATSVVPVSSTDVPAWMTWTDNGDGTATLAGTPPLSLLGTTDLSALTIDIPYTVSGQGFGNGSFDNFEIDVPALNFTADSPTGPLTVNTPYSYLFTTTDPNATFALADGDTLPDGLTLSSAGLLSGTPTAIGAWPLRIVATNANGTSETSPIVLTVQSAAHQLEISAFRLYGPTGTGDWFVSAQNTTSSTIQLFGWHVGIFVPDSTTPVLESLPLESLASGATVTVAGPYFSMSPLIPVDVVGPLVVANPGGFEIIAPDATVVDAAGQSGAPAATIAGTGVAVPTGAAITAQSAYVRNAATSVLVDTDDNASDFTYQSIRFTQSALTFTSTASNSVVGTNYTPSVSGGTTSNTVTYSIDPSSTPGACEVINSVVYFQSVGTCVVTATLPGGAQYRDVSVAQSITVAAAPVENASPASVTTTPVIASVTPTTATTETLGAGPDSWSVYVPVGAVSTPASVILSAASSSLLNGVSFSDGTVAVNLDVTSSSGSAITAFSTPVELTFPDAPADFVPAYSHNGTMWTAIPVIPDPPTLPAGWPDGWYRDSSGTVHILTLHATLYALLTTNSATTQALQITAKVARTLDIDSAASITLHLASSFPSTATITLMHGSTTLAVWRVKSSATSNAYHLRLPRAAIKKGAVTFTIFDKGVGDTTTMKFPLVFFAKSK